MRRSVGLGRRFAVSVWGRLTFYAVVIGLVAYLPPTLAPDLFNWSWTRILFVLWLGGVAVSLAVKPSFWRCPRFWRYVATALAAGLAVAVALALVTWNGGQLLGLALSAGIDDLLTFAPFDYDRAAIDWTVWGVGFARAGALLILAVAILEYRYLKIPYIAVKRLIKRFARKRPAVKAPRRMTLPGRELLLPPLALKVNDEEIEDTRKQIAASFADHAVDVTIDKVFSGPAVTMYGIKPGWEEKRGAKRKRVRVNQIVTLENDLAVELGAANIRFEPVVAGESVIGLEVPNKTAAMVNMRSVIDNAAWGAFESKAEIPFALGLGNGGTPIFTDLTKMPHILIAGTTGSGKSVCVNALILSVLMTRTPSQVRMVLIDPKRVELKHYQGVPHLAAEVITEPEEAVGILEALVAEMERRMQALEDKRARNIVAYNRKARRPFPYLLAIIDELADLMLTTSREVESLLQRLAQLGRATGVHLVVATQRPSVDVVTGLIKANFPSRISFALASQADSRTILDQGGGEKLLGRGDMLYAPIGANKPTRLQGLFLKDAEIDAVAAHWRKYPARYLKQLTAPQRD